MLGGIDQVPLVGAFITVYVRLTAMARCASTPVDSLVDNAPAIQMEDQVSEIEKLWVRCAQSLQDEVSEATWQMWLAQIKPLTYENGVMTFSVPNSVVRERIETRFLPLIQDSLSGAAGAAVTARFFLEERPESSFDTRGAISSQTPPTQPRVTSEPDPVEATAAREQPAGRTGGSSRGEKELSSVLLDPRFTFDTFVAASSNRLAHAAAQAVAENPGRSYNPLFVYGESGLGKTHLLHAIGNYVRSNFPRHVVLYVTTETFMNDFVDALRMSTTIAFKRRYRECDLLLIDDVQFMENKEGLQEEFFHTYNDLHGAAKQIVLTSDRPPKSIDTLEDRLRSRFLSGLITEVDPPDLETRLAILRSKAEMDREEIPDAVLEFIASRVTNNIRELEGALIRVTAFASLNNEPVSMDIVETVLADIVSPENPNPITPEMILEATATSYGFPVEAICGPSRTRPLVTARQVAMYLVREMTDYSYPAIARVFGGRDHTTVIHAVDKITTQMKERRQIYDQVTKLRTTIRAK